MATILQLMARAVEIRDTEIQRRNSSETVGAWCYDVIEYIGGSGAAYDELLQLATEIRNENREDVNSATRMGTWCLKALDFWGYRLNKHIFYYDLARRGRTIRREWRDTLNERRLGAWFVDYLYYIDYAGDTEPGDLLTYVFSDVPQNTAITLNLEGFTGIVVWGDSPQEINYNDENPAHVFTNAGTYTVQIFGTCRAMTAYRVSSSPYTTFRRYLTEIKYWGLIEPLNCEGAFNQCQVLSRIPDDSPEHLFKQARSLTRLFFECYQLPNVKSDFFKSITDNINFVGTALYAFYRCFALTQIPDGLLDSFATQGFRDTSEMFRYCTGITNIPANLFQFYNTDTARIAWVYMVRMFADSGVTTIPGTLLDPLKNVVKRITQLFSNTKITDVPVNLLQNFTSLENGQTSGIFQNCVNLTTLYGGMFSGSRFQNLTQTFYGCTSLPSIPADLFSGIAPEVVSFASMFSLCRSLTDYPVILFNDTMTNTSNVNMSGVFSMSGLLSTKAGAFGNNADKIASLATAFSGAPLQSIHPDTFLGCSNATRADRTFAGYNGTTFHTNEIPRGLFSHTPKITNLEGCFRETINLRIVPDDLLAYTPLVNNIQYLFFASGVREYPPLLFSNMQTSIRLTNIDLIFFASYIEKIPDGFFDALTEVTSANFTFADCTKLQGIPNNLFDKNKNIRSFNNCFRGGMPPDTVLKGQTPKGTDGVELWQRSGQLTQWTVFPENEGYYIRGSDGDIATSRGGYCYSRYYLLPPNETRVVGYGTTNVAAVTYYDSNYVRISAQAYLISSDASPETVIMDIPSNARYVRYSGRMIRPRSFTVALTYPASVVGAGCFRDRLGIENYADIPVQWKS